MSYNQSLFTTLSLIYPGYVGDYKCPYNQSLFTTLSLVNPGYVGEYKIPVIDIFLLLYLWFVRYVIVRYVPSALHSFKLKLPVTNATAQSNRPMI